MTPLVRDWRWFEGTLFGGGLFLLVMSGLSILNIIFLCCFCFIIFRVNGSSFGDVVKIFSKKFKEIDSYGKKKTKW